MAVVNGYTTLSELKSFVNIADSNDDSELEDAINSASRQIDAYCGRQFYADGAATAKVYRTSDRYKVVVDDNNSNNVSYDDEGNLKPKRKNDDQPPSSQMMIITNTIKFYLKEEKVPSFFNKYMD